MMSRSGTLGDASTVAARRPSVTYVTSAYPIELDASTRYRIATGEDALGSSMGRSRQSYSYSSRRSIGSSGFSKSYGRTECQEYTLDFRMVAATSCSSMASASFTGGSTEREMGSDASFFRNTTCCGVYIRNLHELLLHHEEFHDDDAVEFTFVEDDDEWAGAGAGADDDEDLDGVGSDEDGVFMVMELDEDLGDDDSAHALSAVPGSPLLPAARRRGGLGDLFSPWTVTETVAATPSAAAVVSAAAAKPPLAPPAGNSRRNAPGALAALGSLGSLGSSTSSANSSTAPSSLALGGATLRLPTRVAPPQKRHDC